MQTTQTSSFWLCAVNCSSFASTAMRCRSSTNNSFKQNKTHKFETKLRDAALLFDQPQNINMFLLFHCNKHKQCNVNTAQSLQSWSRRSWLFHNVRAQISFRRSRGQAQSLTDTVQHRTCLQKVHQQHNQQVFSQLSIIFRITSVTAICKCQSNEQSKRNSHKRKKL